MNENNWKEKFDKADLYECEYGCDGANEECCGNCSYSYLSEDKVKKFISQTLQQQREEISKEIEQAERPFGWNEQSWYEAKVGILEVINPPQKHRGEIIS